MTRSESGDFEVLKPEDLDIVIPIQRSISGLSRQTAAREACVRVGIRSSSSDLATLISTFRPKSALSSHASMQILPRQVAF